MNEQDIILSTVQYYAVEGNFSHMRTCLLNLLKRFGSDPLLLYWRGFSMILEDRLIDGLRELTNLQDTPELLLCVPQLLKYAHRKCETVDNEAIKKLDELMKSTKSSLTSKDYYYAGLTMWLIGKHDRARDYIDKVLKNSPQDKEALSIRGWIDLTCSKEPLVKKSLKYFDEAFSVADKDSPPLDAILGKIRYNFIRYNYTQALDLINTYSSQFPDFIPLYLEKITVQIARMEWDEAVETAKRCFINDSSCVQAACLMALEKCVNKGDMNESAKLLGNLLSILDQSEPRSHVLYYTASRTFSRLANGHSLLLQQTMTLMDRALSINSRSYEYVVELGYQHMMAGNTDQAMKCFKMGISVDQTSMTASIGVVQCLLKKGQLKSAIQQLEFLTEVVKDKSQSSVMYYLNALMQKKKGANSEIVIQLLDSAITAHFAEVKGFSLGMKYLFLINPYFVMKIAETIMEYAPSDPSSLSESSCIPLQSVTRLLDPLTVAVPGLLYIQLTLAKIKYLSGDFSNALTVSQTCIDGSYKRVEAHLLQAMIYLHQKNNALCSQALEAALSCSFEVQQYPLYHIIKGRQLLVIGKLEDSHKFLETAISLKNTPNTAVGGTLLPTPSTGEWISAYLGLFEALNRLQLTHDAARIIQEAMEQFSGTPDEARITTANAELFIARGNTKEALNLLSRVTEDKPFYIQAKERMADIYLNYERDKSKYIQCYKELAEKLPGPPTTQLLGDAYMNIQELDSAIEVFENAIRKSPKDGVLASKIGQAYIKAHSYSKAVQYYENSLRTNDVFSMRYELASIYLQLKSLDKAEKTALKGLEQSKDTDSTEYLKEKVQYHLLLAKIYHAKNMNVKSINCLEIARNTQAIVVKRIAVERPELEQKEMKQLTQIVLQHAKHFEQMPEGSPKAEECYQQILEVDEDCSEARTSLVNLFLSNGDIEQSEEHCLKLLRKNESAVEDDAALLMAELLVLKDNPQGAAKHMEDILIKKPDHYKCLARLIDIKRRLGDLISAKTYISQAESFSAQSAYEPQLIYCKGLYHKYLGQTEDALLLFNQIRNSPVCGKDALFNMIEMCLINDDDLMGMESLKSTDKDSHSADADLMACRTAEKLLQELNPSAPLDILHAKVLRNFLLLSSKSRASSEKVLINVQELSTVDRENASLLLLAAIAYIFMKQVPRARNQLKRLSKLPWTVRDAEDLERGWILLADLYMQSGKYDLAIEQLKKCLKFNKSCSKASECLGYISEKEHAYQDAAMHYENAWKYGHMTNPVVGYRLAFNFLKAHQYMKAVDVCHQVLGKHPSYPRIKKDILDKARQSIRN